MWNKFLKKHFEGPGGISALLPIAVPMFLSSMFEMLMMFIDRMFLSYVDVVAPSSAMAGGVSNWMVMSFFCGVVGYSSTLTAQYFGAGQKNVCRRMVRQAVVTAMICYPLILLIDCGVVRSPLFTHLPEKEMLLGKRYFWYMAFGSVIGLTRFAVSSFFTGIGKTKIIMVANVVALFVNVIANWVLIFGHCGFQALGIDGAAIGTLISSISAAVLLTVAYSMEKKRPEWQDPNAPIVDFEKIKKLIRYGAPQGVENILGTLCFMLLVSSFHSYGDDMAAATTISFNWDSFSFHPLLGLQVGVMTLVGQAMGAGKPDVAQRAARSGFKVGILYAVFMITLFLTCTGALVGVFTPESTGLDYGKVREYAIPMLRLAGLYLMTDAILLISVGTMRGAGDTFWCMLIHLFNNAVGAGVVLMCVYKLKLPPLVVWTIFVGTALFSSATLFTRYKLGHWKKLRIIGTQG